jgi:hypothetical protein
MRPRATLLLLLGGLISVVVLPLAQGQTSVESELLSLINGGRSGPVVLHSGLRSVGRTHSQEMAQEGGLNHDGAERRIFSAPPDPEESDGAPDNGFTGTWCENVAYVRGAPESEVAQRIYEGWTNSASHNRCMNDDRMTAAGVGLYFDGDRTYWATYESAVDRTPPGTAAAATPTPSPSPTPEPEIVPTLRTEPPEPTEPPERTEEPDRTAQPGPGRPTLVAVNVTGAEITERSVGTLSRTDAEPRRLRGSTTQLVAAPAVQSSARSSFGWAETLATLAVLGLLGEFLRRLSRLSDQNETK